MDIQELLADQEAYLRRIKLYCLGLFNNFHQDTDALRFNLARVLRDSNEEMRMHRLIENTYFALFEQPNFCLRNVMERFNVPFCSVYITFRHDGGRAIIAARAEESINDLVINADNPQSASMAAIANSDFRNELEETIRKTFYQGLERIYSPELCYNGRIPVLTLHIAKNNTDINYALLPESLFDGQEIQYVIIPNAEIN